jgi:glycosyltransferase involved in cell wall biosynthesis
LSVLRLLILAPNPVESATTRYRIAQYLPGLAREGIVGDLVPFLTPELFGRMYRTGGTWAKSIGIARSIVRRLQLILRARQYDAVFISREAMTLGPPIIEWIFAHFADLPLIFDFDDATWVPYRSPTYGNLTRWIKPPGKTATIIAMSRTVVAGNRYLADYARQFNQATTIIPTVVDTAVYQSTPPNGRRQDIPVIGWIGSHSTSQYLRLITKSLERVRQRHRFIFRVMGAGEEIRIPGVEVENLPWVMATEVGDFRSLDIGVYPIIEDEWSRGKCAFKAIQYQAAGVACVASPIGMNLEVIESGGNGLLAGTAEEWVGALERLLADVEYRRQLAMAGRLNAVARYSLEVQAPRLAAAIRGAVSTRQ